MMNGREHTKYVLAKSGYEPEERKCCSRGCKCCSCIILTLVIAGAAVAVYLVLFHPWGPTKVCSNGIYVTNNKSSSAFVVNTHIGIQILPPSGNETTQLHYIRAMVLNGTQEKLVYNLEENVDQTWIMFTEVSGTQANNPVNIPAPGLPVNQWLYLSFNRKANDTTLTVELQAGESSYQIPVNGSEVLDSDFNLVMGGYNISAPYEVSYDC